MRRLVIHAGFHKTGTSTVQQILRKNRPALKPYMRSILRAGLVETVHAARGYSTWRDPLSLAKFDRRFRRLLSGVAPMPRRVLCLSAEELSGHMPGHDTLMDYGAAPVLATRMARAATHLYPRAEVVFVYSTRDPQAWLRSSYWEHVKASSLTLDFEAFAEKYAGAEDLDRIVDQVAEAVRAKVHRFRLEAHSAAPATPLLALCDVPADVHSQFAALPPANSFLGDDVLAQLLAANRTIPDPAARKDAKVAILQAARKESP